jgi:RimJ/RimL family protein N-acetyltransferase
LSEYRLEPWGEGDEPLLQRLLGDPVMTEHLFGPESPEKIAERHQRYLKLPGTGTGEMFKVVDAAGESVGSIGYWDRESHEGEVYETGWAVLPEFQGRGIATTATAQLVELLRAGGKRQYLYAYPSVDNAPSNAICRKLGFELTNVTEYEYPKDSGNIMRCNDWRLDLFADASG